MRKNMYNNQSRKKRQLPIGTIEGRRKDPSDRNRTMFMAAHSGHATVVAALLAAGADKEADTPHGTPLEIARSRGHGEVVSLLE